MQTTVFFHFSNMFLSYSQFFPARTTAAASLFTELYTFAGKDYQYYNNLSFVPVYNPNTIDPLLKYKALDACMALNSTAKLPNQCSEYYDPSFFYKSCIEDVVVTGLAEASSPSIRVYSVLCYQYLKDSNRMHITFCLKK